MSELLRFGVFGVFPSDEVIRRSDQFFKITTRYAAFRNTAFSSAVALYLIGVPNMQYDDVRLDSVKTVYRVFSPEYRVLIKGGDPRRIFLEFQI